MQAPDTTAAPSRTSANRRRWASSARRAPGFYASAAAQPRRSKTVWVKTRNKAALTAGLEAGLTTFLFDDKTQAEAWSSLASYKQLLVQPTPVTAQPKGGLAATQAVAAPIIDVQTGKQEAVLHMVRGAEDLKHLMSQLSETHTDTSSQRTLVVDATDWKIIPAENLVALVQSQPGTRLLATAATCQDALTMLGALEVGTHGVVLVTDSPTEVRQLAAALAQQAGDTVTLQRATVTQVTPLDMGDRVCVDLTCMMRPGEGLLVGSFARGLFLVHSECADSDYINARPFRVNAGAVHSYLLAPGGRTAYLSELRSAAPVAVIAPDGTCRTGRVGRCKIESRPMVFIEARTDDGVPHNVVLQNAETVKLVGWSHAHTSPSHTTTTQTNTDFSQQQQEPTEATFPSESMMVRTQQGEGWSAISVATLGPGDHVLVHCPDVLARHTGMAVEEWIVER